LKKGGPDREEDRGHGLGIPAVGGLGEVEGGGKTKSGSAKKAEADSECRKKNNLEGQTYMRICSRSQCEAKPKGGSWGKRATGL